MSEDDELTGKLLLSLPRTREDAFYRTVVFLLRHGPMLGALGVVLNRPTPIVLDEIFPELIVEASAPRVLFAGGPVEPDGIICLGRGAPNADTPGFVPVLDQWVSIDPREPPPVGVSEVRVYRGYAGWAPRQLESELARDGWLVVDALLADLTTDEPATLWERVVDRQGARVARIKRVPRDPSLN